jgi:subtilase family serine protease
VTFLRYRANRLASCGSYSHDGRMSRWRPLAVVFIVLLTSLSVSVGEASASGSGTKMVRPAQLSAGKAPFGSRALGPVSPTRQISLRIVLPPSHETRLRQLLAALYDRASPRFHDWLRRGQFESEFGPSARTVTAVESWLKGVGLKSELSGPAVSIAAPAQQMAAALGTSFERYRSPSGQSGYLARRTPQVPVSLAHGQIAVILGLNTVATFKSPKFSKSAVAPTEKPSLGQVHDDGLTPCAAAKATAGSQYLTLDQVGAAYQFGSLLANGQNGHGKTVGVYELGNHFPSDIASYEKCFGLSNPVSTVKVDGGGISNGGDATIEADLDIETLATEAPGASIISYEGPGNSLAAAYDTWSVIVSDDAAQAISTSFGECEPQAESDGDITAYTPLFEQAAAQGQTITAATGDFGSTDCIVPGATGPTTEEVDFPGSDAWVTAVGGTTLSGTAPEVTWNDCQSDESDACAKTGQAGGGGSSRYVERPAYQPNVLSWARAQPCGLTCREVPDISANSGTRMVDFSNGSFGFSPGTSFAAPLMAALATDIDVGCTASVGFLNPMLYALYREGTYGTAFTDITQGNNDLTGANGGNYRALPGYDAATGIGSPLATGLSCPEITSVSPGASGNVTLVGLGLEKASITIGGHKARVTSATATHATVVLPSGRGQRTFKATSEVGAGNETSTFRIGAGTTSAIDPGN